MKFFGKHKLVHVLRKEKKNNLEVACWDRPNLIPHAVPLFISILQRFDSTHLKMNETISIFRCQRIWFHAQMIHLFHSTIVYSAPTGSSSDFSLRQILSQCSLARIAKPALQSAWQECHLFPKGSVMLIRRLLIFLLILINALFLHCWRPVWTSTFLDIKSDAAMQQRFNRRARSWIFEWISDVGLCLYAKGQVQVLQAWWDPSLAPHCIKKEAVRRFGTMPMFVKGLSQACIAVILVWCDKHVPGIRNISKTGQFHPCIGSGTNWRRVNCWCCTLQYFIWSKQEWNKMDLSSFHCSWLALGGRSPSKKTACRKHQSTPLSTSTEQASLKVLTAKLRSICFLNVWQLMISFSNHGGQHFSKITHMRTYLVFGVPPPHFHRFLHTKNTTVRYFSSS